MPLFKVSNLSLFAVSRGALRAGRYPLLGRKALLYRLRSLVGIHNQSQDVSREAIGAQG